ncbi:Fc.00g023380.m01.CDS01 [Cosmosporella sp. VM-42]
MEADTANRYRSRILREMNANRDNPFNSPPSSTGSHGTVSPTLSSVFSDPDGESTRRLNEDIARVTAPRKLPVNWEAAHRKWPEFFGMPKSRDVPIFNDDTDTRPMSAESKENKPPAAVKFADDSTQETWMNSGRTRAEMQPRVDDGSDLSSILSKSPGRALSNPALAKNTRNPSPLAKVQTRSSSDTMLQRQEQRRGSISEAIDRLRNTSRSPQNCEQRQPAPGHNSPRLSSGKSSLTAVPPSPESMVNVSHNDTNVRSFFMPDVSHLGDFVTGTLRFSGSMKNGVPIFVKNGRVHDRREQSSAMRHAEVDAFELPEDEEKIFVSMDMIREEIVSLQEHYDKVQEYAETLQQQVEELQAQLRSRKSSDGGFSSHQANEQLIIQKNRLEVEVSTLQSRLEQASRKISLSDIENDAVVQEKDRAVRKLQEACEDINKLTRKLSVKEKELETTHKQLESTEQMRQDNDTLRRDLRSLKHGRDSLDLENTSLKADNETLRREQANLKEEIESLRSDNNSVRREHQSLINENRSLRVTNKTLITENEDLRENLDGVQHELDAVREEIEALQQDVQVIGQEKSTLREDNSSLVRHNEKYFGENKVLRKENSGFERSLHELHDDNLKLKEEVEFLKQQLDHCRPLPKDDFSAQLDEETEENMTSAFFIPDITINTNESGRGENTETRDIPDVTVESDKLPTIPDITEEPTRNTTKPENTSHSEKRETEHKSRSKSRASSGKTTTQNQKVAFSIPDKSSQKTSSNVANKGSKRRIASQASYQSSFKEPSGRVVDPFNDDTTGLQSVDNTTQDQSMQLDVTPKSRKEGIMKEKRQSTIQDITSNSQKSQHTRSHSRSSHRHTSMTEVTADSIRTTVTDTCPTLSNDARRVLDGLCEHNCRNCIVCSRITSHRGVVSSADIVRGKKRVTVPRPIPVTDRDDSVEDPTMRPAQSPGHALALVIKGLEDEAHHLQLELSALQAKYNGSDKSLARRERLNMAEGIRTLLKRLEVKNDQIYSLYDVLEGQKAAGQAMSEEEVEMTVLNITGMTVRDVTSGSDQLTWEGIR